MSQRMVDLHQNYFGGLTRKIQERQVFCEGAYPQRSVTEQNTKYFTVFFRAVFKYKQDKANEHLLLGAYGWYVTKTKRSSTQYRKVFQNSGSKINQMM